MKTLYRRLKRTVQQWWECRQHRCDYWGHYLAYGPPDMPHDTWHLVAEQGLAHFRDCRWNFNERMCPTCLSYEKRLRA